MKKFVLSLVMSLVVGLTFSMPMSTAYASGTDKDFSITAKAGCLMNYHTGEIAWEQNGQAKLPTASMTKIMTLNLIFDQIEDCKLSYEDDVVVSDRAESMGGSQVFLEANGVYKVKDLIKAIAVCSANDASTAMAEKIGGSVEGFVSMMNQKAVELGMVNTNFANPTGLPHENGYSTAIDVAKMTRELLTNSEYFNYSKIWLDEIVHNGGRVSEISNTNKLLRRNIGVDGGKTGFTSEAKHCISATSKKGNMRLIAVIVGGVDSKTRFDECEGVLNYGYGAYVSEPIVKKDTALEEVGKVSRGCTKEVVGVAEKDYFSFVKRGDIPTEIVEIIYNDKIKAPIAVGDIIGIIKVYKDGAVIDEINILAKNAVEKKGFFDFF